MEIEEGDNNKPVVSTVTKWIKYLIIAIINLLLLAFLASFLNNQPFSLFNALSIIADSMGIVLGLLGVWFYFLSEKLNRDAAINLQKTTDTVTDLREKMWAMITEVFETYREQNHSQKIEEKAFETEAAIEDIKQSKPENEIDDQAKYLNAIEKMNERINLLEQSQNQNPISFRSVRTISNEDNYFRYRVIARKILQSNTFPIKYEDLLFQIARELSTTKESAMIALNYLFSIHYFVITFTASDDESKSIRDQYVKPGTMGRKYLSKIS